MWLCNRSAEISDFFDTLFLSQFVTFPTRENSILISYYRINRIFPMCPLMLPCQTRITIRDFKNADNDKIVHALTSIDWWSVFDSYVDIDDVYSRFIAILHEIIDRHVPLEQFERHSSKPSKSPLFRKVTKELEFHIKRFLTYKVKKMAACKHMKRLYEYINKVKKSPNLHKVLEDSEGIKYTTDSAKAEALADYFASVFEKSPLFTPTLPSLSSTHFELPTVSYRKVLRSLRALKPSLSPTADGVPQFFFKQFSEYLAVPVTHVLNMSLMLGQVPKIWKTLMSHPYLKQGTHASFPTSGR
ncbi:hypothetical protein COOONC_02994 [Cooperia oncophora]